jgi:hypothetical protein
MHDHTLSINDIEPHLAGPTCELISPRVGRKVDRSIIWIA